MTNRFLDLMLDSTLNGRPHGAGPLAFARAPDGALAFAPAPEESAAPDPTLAYAAATKAPVRSTFEQRWSAWASAFGSGLNANGDSTVGSSSVSARIYGMAAGLDYRWGPDTMTGFAMAGGTTNWSVTQGLGTGRSDVVQGGAYALTHFGPAYLAGALSFIG